MLEYLGAGWALVGNFPCMLVMVGGIVLGMIFGCIPGLTTNMCLAIMLPISYSLQAMQAVSLLVGIYVGGTYGACIGAILINIPGTPASVATTFDGYPMTQKGLAGKALGVAMFYSFIGTILGFIALVTISPLLASIGLKFGFYEFFALGVLTLSLISGVVSDSLIKGLGAAVLGIAISCIGIAPIDGAVRLTFGYRYMVSGVKILPLTIGLYAVSALLEYAEAGTEMNIVKMPDYKIKGFGFSVAEFFSEFWNMIRSAVIGIFIGILPGMGANISNLVAYSVGKSLSKNPKEWGKGAIGGVVASETSNNATLGGAIIPLLTLGIPGDSSTALMLSCLVVFGVTPGPFMFVSQKGIVYSIYIVMFLSALVSLLVVRGGLSFFVSLLKIPKYYLLPVFVLLSAVGVLGAGKVVSDIWVCLVAGLLAWFCKKVAIPITPLVIAFIISPLIETNLRRGLMFAPNHTIWEFFTSPLANSLFIATFVILWFSVYSNLRRRKRQLEIRSETD
jgi:putative tricarboxylic transport membrane protein